MSDWSMDERLRQAQELPDWQDLPGQGKPLNLNQDAYTPEDMRLAYKVLKENNLAPAWIEEGKGLDHDRDRLMDRIRRSGHPHEPLSRMLSDAIISFNKRILTYNLKLPPGIAHKSMIDL